MPRKIFPGSNMGMYVHHIKWSGDYAAGFFNARPMKVQKKEKKEGKVPSIADVLTQTLCRSYEPVNSPEEETELKTTLEIMEEMGSIADVKKKEIVAALLKAGFKTIYNDAGFYWIMKRK